MKAEKGVEEHKAAAERQSKMYGEMKTELTAAQKAASATAVQVKDIDHNYIGRLAELEMLRPGSTARAHIHTIGKIGHNWAKGVERNLKGCCIGEGAGYAAGGVGEGGETGR